MIPSQIPSRMLREAATRDDELDDQDVVEFADMLLAVLDIPEVAAAVADLIGPHLPQPVARPAPSPSGLGRTRRR